MKTLSGFNIDPMGRRIRMVQKFETIEVTPTPQFPNTVLAKTVVVITVYNSPHLVRPCIQAFHKRTPSLVSLIIIDDCSDKYTSEMIEEEIAKITISANFRQVIYTKHETNQKYTKSVNEGFKIAYDAGAKWIIALNSDTLVTPGWVERLLAIGESNEDVGMVCPFMSNAAMLTVAMAPGTSYIETAERLSTFKRDPNMAAVTPVGSCMMIHRECWEEIGPFDEKVSPEGYGEECHFWANATAKDWRALIANDSYIWHRSHGSFGNGASKRERDAVETFLKIHGPRYSAARAKNPDPRPIVEERVAYIRTKNDRPNFAFFVCGVQLCGGVLALVNIANRLIERGINATVAFQRDSYGEWQMMPAKFSPIIVREAKDWKAAGGFENGLVFATAWHTGFFIKSLCQHYQNIRTGAFIQDREDQFRKPDGNLEYERIDKFQDFLDIAAQGRTVVNSNWVLQSMQQEYGLQNLNYIPIGVDPDMFYPRDLRGNGKKVRIIAFSRWSTPRRGYHILAAVYKKLHERYGDLVELLTYDQVPDNDVPCKHLGKVPQNQLAEAFAWCDILLETSYSQGWGMPAQEMMSTGGAVVSTDNGGIHNYGKHDENCLIVPANADDMFVAACKLVEDAELRKRLGEAGRKTAEYLSWDRIASAWASLINKWENSR